MKHLIKKANKNLLYTFSTNDGKFKDKNDAINYIEKLDKPCVYTYGLEYKHPTTHRVPVTKEEAIEKIKNNSLVDITEETDVIHINAYSSNDMY